jgi:hypothetical protein
MRDGSIMADLKDFAAQFISSTRDYIFIRPEDQLGQTPHLHYHLLLPPT